MSKLNYCDFFNKKKTLVSVQDDDFFTFITTPIPPGVSWGDVSDQEEKFKVRKIKFKVKKIKFKVKKTKKIKPISLVVVNKKKNIFNILD